MTSRLAAHGVPLATASHLAHLPPVGLLFAAFLGYNPVSKLLGPHVLAGLTHQQATTLTGRAFFPSLTRDRSSTPWRSCSSPRW